MPSAIEPDDRLAGGHLNAAISNAIVRIVAEYTGRGPTRARTTIHNGWVFVTLEDTLTKGERQLAVKGKADWVRETRKVFQEAMREDFTHEVETLTGQRVVAFMSDNHVDPDVGVEIFLLDGTPNGGEPPSRDGASADGDGASN